MVTNTKVSVNILTFNRASLLKRAIDSARAQTYESREIIVVDNGSKDNTAEVLRNMPDIKILSNPNPLGITFARQQALEASAGEYIAILDDDDEWIDSKKLEKQVEFLDENPECVLVGGGIEIYSAMQNSNQDQVKNLQSKIVKFRPTSDEAIRQAMLFRNNFFTSTVMFKRQAALEVGGFVKDEYDLAEDYDLWLRLGRAGKMRNFLEPFTAYARPNYNKDRQAQFLKKQLKLIKMNAGYFPFYFFAALILKIRIWANGSN